VGAPLPKFQGFFYLGGIPPPIVTNPDVISYARLFPSEGIEMKSGLTAPLSDYPFLYPQNLAIFRFGGNSVFFFWGGGMFPPQNTPEFLRPHHPSNRQTHLRIISTQENYPWNAWIGTDKKIFLCVKVISSNPEPTWQRKIFFSVPIHGWFSTKLFTGNTFSILGDYIEWNGSHRFHRRQGIILNLLIIKLIKLANHILYFDNTGYLVKYIDPVLGLDQN
jgi:hypothetical protein